MGGRSLCRASLVFRVRGSVKVLGLGFCVRVKVSVTGRVSYLNENCSLHTSLLSAPAIHRQSSPECFTGPLTIRNVLSMVMMMMMTSKCSILPY